MRLLVVEDDPDLNRQLATALIDAGYVVDRAFDGEEGHYLGESEPYDAVILDIGLPKMDGISVLEGTDKTLREVVLDVVGGRDIPIIANVNCGHAGPNVPLPLGVRAGIDAGARTIELLEGAVA